MNRRDNKASAPSQILHYLYQGKAPREKDFGAIASMGISSVINCTNHIDNVFESYGLAYMRVPLEDAADASIYDYFDTCNEFISLCGGVRV